MPPPPEATPQMHGRVLNDGLSQTRVEVTHSNEYVSMGMTELSRFVLKKRSGKKRICLQDTPPRKAARQMSMRTMEWIELVRTALNTREAPSTRLEHAIGAWTRSCDTNTTEIWTRELGLLRDVVHALVFTGYFPLQHCFFSILMSLAQQHDQISEIRVWEQLRQLLEEPLRNVLDQLPRGRSTNAGNVAMARTFINKVNARFKACTSTKVARCWVSSGSKEQLVRVKIQRWLDVGDTTATFYKIEESGEATVVNVPFACLDDIEVDSSNDLLYLTTKHVLGLEGTSMVVFMLDNKVWLTMRLDLRIKRVNKIKDVEAIEQAIRERSSLHPPVTCRDIPSNQCNAAVVTPVKASHTHHSIVGSDRDRTSRARSPSESELQPKHFSSPKKLDFDVSQDVEDGDPFATLRQNFHKSSVAIVSLVSDICTEHISQNHQVTRGEYLVRSACDESQRFQLLQVPHVETEVENQVKSTSNRGEARCRAYVNALRELSASMRHHTSRSRQFLLQWFKLFSVCLGVTAVAVCVSLID